MDKKQQDSQHQPAYFLRRKEVQKRIGLSRSTLYLKIKNGEFPAPVKLGARASGWLASEIDEWAANLVQAARRKKS